MLKRIIGIIGIMLILCVPTLSSALDWHTANQATVGWDAVTVASGTVNYTLYLVNAITDVDKTNPVEIGTTDQLEYTITLNTEGQYLVGVKSIRMVDGENVGESVIGWSDDPIIVKDGITFGVRYFEPPTIITGLGTR